MLLVPENFFSLGAGRLWIDNVYLRLHHCPTPSCQVRPALWRTPSLLALGHNRASLGATFTEDYYPFPKEEPPPPPVELHVTNVTFQSDGVQSVHGVRAVGAFVETSAYLTGAASDATAG